MIAAMDDNISASTPYITKKGPIDSQKDIHMLHLNGLSGSLTLRESRSAIRWPKHAKPIRLIIIVYSCFYIVNTFINCL